MVVCLQSRDWEHGRFFYPKRRRFGMLLESPIHSMFERAVELRQRFGAIFTHRRSQKCRMRSWRRTRFHT